MVIRLLVIALLFLLLIGCAGAQGESVGRASTATTVAATPPPLPPPTVDQSGDPAAEPTGTSAIHELSGVQPSGEMLAPNVIAHVLTEADGPKQVPTDVNWTVQDVTFSYPTQRWRLVREHSDWFEVETRRWYAQRLRIEEPRGASSMIVVDLISADGLPGLFLAADQWSPDEANLYLTVSGGADGCDLYGFRNGYYDLKVPSGELTELVPRDWSLNVVGISPDQGKVAYVGIKDQMLTLRTLADGSEQQIALPAAGGGFTWSPSSDKLAYTSVTGVCEGETPATTIYLIDLTENTVRELTRDESRFLDIESWTNIDRILLIDRARYWLNPDNGEIKSHPN